MSYMNPFDSLSEFICYKLSFLVAHVTGVTRWQLQVIAVEECAGEMAATVAVIFLAILL